MPKKYLFFSVSTDVETKTKLKELAKKTQRSQSQIVNMLISREWERMRRNTELTIAFDIAQSEAQNANS